MASHPVPGCRLWAEARSVDKVEHKAEVARWTTLKYSMQELLHHSAWDVYANELEQSWLRHMDKDLMTTADYGQLRYYQGVIDGLRRAASLPQDLIHRADKAAPSGRSPAKE